MKKWLLLAALVWSSAASAEVKLAHYWSFDGFNNFATPSSLPDTLPYDPDGIWTLNLNKHDAPAATTASEIWPASVVTLNKYGYNATYGGYYHLGHVGVSENYAYLSSSGSLPGFLEEWAFSITAWVRIDTVSSMVLFSTGNIGEGIQLRYDGVSDSLTFRINGVASDFGSLKMGGAFAGDSDFRHIGISMANDGKGNLTVNYFLNGVQYAGKTGSVADVLDRTYQGFNIGSDGSDPSMTGVCNYDEIKIFTGVLSDADIKEAMKLGTASFEIYDPASAPEPSSALMAGLGAALFCRRRRPA